VLARKDGDALFGNIELGLVGGEMGLRHPALTLQFVHGNPCAASLICLVRKAEFFHSASDPTFTDPTTEPLDV